MQLHQNMLLVWRISKLLVHEVVCNCTKLSLNIVHFNVPLVGLVCK